MFSVLKWSETNNTTILFMGRCKIVKQKTQGIPIASKKNWQCSLLGKDTKIFYKFVIGRFKPLRLYIGQLHKKLVQRLTCYPNIIVKKYMGELLKFPASRAKI